MRSDIEIQTANVAALHVNKDEDSDKPTTSRSSSLNHERSIHWDKDESAVIYWIVRCCANDLDIIEENGTAKK